MEATAKSSRRDLVTVMSTLGHSKIETTQRYLSEDFEVSARVANQVVANIFDSTPAKKNRKRVYDPAPLKYGARFFYEIQCNSGDKPIYFEK